MEGMATQPARRTQGILIDNNMKQMIAHRKSVYTTRQAHKRNLLNLPPEQTTIPGMNCIGSHDTEDRRKIKTFARNLSHKILPRGMREFRY
jgi:hypothetical protein